MLNASGRDDGNLAVNLVERNFAAFEGEEGVIATDANIFTRVKTGSALSHDDIAGDHGFATVFLDPEHLRIAVSSVFGGSLSFFMCHDKFVSKVIQIVN